MKDRDHSVRWWPVVTILLLATASILFTWTFVESIRQFKVVTTITISALVSLLLLLWLLFFSRMRLRLRLSILGIVVLGVAVFVTLFRFRELSGDLVPIFEWRWQERAVSANTQTVEPTDALHSDRAPNHNYPQFLGPNRTGIIREIQLDPNWETNPPRLLWKQPVGKGWSSFAILGMRAITHEQRGPEEWVSCYELTTGRLLWQHAEQTRFEHPLGGVGPRATPTITDGRVYALGATGMLNCLDLETGSEIWETNILKDNNADLPLYGVSNSPLVIDSLVVVCAGGKADRSLIAYHKDDGRIIWHSGDNPAAYSSPMLVNLAGQRQILNFDLTHVVGYRPIDGEILWEFRWPPETEKVAQPLLLPDNRVFVTSGYGVGSKMLQVERDDDEFSVAVLWENIRLKSKFANAIYDDGHIYGLDDGILVCLDALTGARQWKRGRYGHGQLLLIGDLLLVQAESGDVVLVQANPQRFEEIASLPAISGKTWNHPAFAAPYLLVRNGQEAACYELALK